MAGRPPKYPIVLVEKIRYERNVNKRSLKWLAKTYDIPIDTIRDWLYRGHRKTV